MVKRDIQVSTMGPEATTVVLNENGKRASEPVNEVDKKRVKTRGLFRQPTVRELNRLQETETLFNSNLFRLQVEEILEEVKLKEKVVQKFNQWFETLKNYLEDIPIKENEYDLTENTLFKDLKVKSPFTNELKKIKCTFKFHKFLKVELTGSYSLECAINSKLRVDVQVTMPAETYNKNDSLNYRYHKKRLAYIAYLASHIKKSEIIEEVKYTVLNGDESHPLLDITPKGKISNFVAVRIHVACDSEAFKLHRFSPTRNNLRESWLFGTENTSDTGPPTPYYNCSVLQDLTSQVNQELLASTLGNSDNLRQAIVLLKIWLRQRKLEVSGFVVSMFVAYLVQLKRINNVMSSYQIVRNVWICLKTSEWDTKGITLNKETTSPPIQEYLDNFPVVFLDKTGYYNICYQMTRGTYAALKRESALAVEMLDNTNINSFIPLFMTKIDDLAQFDDIVRFKNLSQVKQAIDNTTEKSKKINYGINKLSSVIDTLDTLLAKGLGNRVDLILHRVEADFSWSVNEALEKAKVNKKYDEKLSFGFILNSENALNIVEKGPPANLPEAEQFRAFWGDKSELRRFQDGAITETCVWDADSIMDRRTVNKQIVRYLLELKYGITSELLYTSNQLDVLLTCKQYTLSNGIPTGIEEFSQPINNGLDELRRELRGLTSLPLDVSSVYGVSPVCSTCAAVPPPPCAPLPPAALRRGGAALVKGGSGAGYLPVCDVVIELNHSSKWPGEIEAFRCLKAAFNLQIADQLRKQYSLATQAYPGHIDVLKNGYVYRLTIAHSKEITLLRKVVENGVAKYRDTDESLNLQYNTVLLPRLRGALNGLYQRHSAFGPTTALAKRWLSSHLLDEANFPETVVELLVATVFVQPEPMLAPTQPLAGFVRFLKLLAEKDWDKEMVVLDFNGDMKREDITELELKFASRDVAESPCMHIVTSQDGDSSGVWTRGLTRAVLKRSRTLAAAASKFIENKLCNELNDDILGTFVPSLKGYDVIIHLHSELVPLVAERVDREPQWRQVAPPGASDVIPVADFHPVRCYLQELRSAFSDFAMFFHDSYGGLVIAVLWKPDIDETKEFQVSTANGLKAIKSKGEVKYKVNKKALIEDFKIIGEGIVKDVVVN